MGIRIMACPARLLMHSLVGCLASICNAYFHWANGWKSLRPLHKTVLFIAWFCGVHGPSFRKLKWSSFGHEWKIVLPGCTKLIVHFVCLARFGKPSPPFTNKSWRIPNSTGHNTCLGILSKGNLGNKIVPIRTACPA